MSELADGPHVSEKKKRLGERRNSSNVYIWLISHGKERE